MFCDKCKDKAVFESPKYCKKHFIQYIEDKVFATIKKYKLINKGDKICVAASGGKDSLTVLHILKKKHDIEAIAVDEGIKDYRNSTLIDLRGFCKKEKIRLKVYSFKNEFKKNLDEMSLKDKTPCAVCGTFRRFLLNKYSKEYDVIATGHNLDDEAQAILMNFLKPNIKLTTRIGPKTGSFQNKKFTKRIKPLYFLSEKEIRAYTILKGIKTNFSECPNVIKSFRSKVRDQLNLLENKKPGSKKRLIDNFLKLQKKIQYHEKKMANYCKECGFISKEDVCRACQLADEI